VTSLDPSLVALHDDVRGLLEDWTHAEPGQLHLRDQYLAFLDEHPDALSRSCAVGHVTASALVMDDARIRTLLTLHPKAGRWLQLGGHCEPGDATFRDAVLREVREESGIDDVRVSSTPLRIDRHPVPCGGGMSEHLDVEFLALVPSDAQAVMSEESDDLRWFEVDDLPPDLDDAVRRMIDTAVGGHPL
jgi:8-oxo-dGTP pyrophosphatase MutT (NUDIX family)